MTTERIGPPLRAGERETLRAFLDFHRATLAMKCEGLTDEELRRRAVPSSQLTLLGLLRHLAEVERAWFRRVIDAEDVPLVWSDTGDYQQAYDADRLDRCGGVRGVAAGGRALPAYRAGGGLARRHRPPGSLGRGRVAAAGDAAHDARVRPPQRPRRPAARGRRRHRGRLTAAAARWRCRRCAAAAGRAVPRPSGQLTGGRVRSGSQASTSWIFASQYPHSWSPGRSPRSPATPRSRASRRTARCRRPGVLGAAGHVERRAVSASAACRAARQVVVGPSATGRPPRRCRQTPGRRPAGWCSGRRGRARRTGWPRRRTVPAARSAHFTAP